MENITVKRLEDTEFQYQDVVSLLHLSFEERIEQGLLFTCSTITEAEYRKKMERGVCLVAVKSDSKQPDCLVGTIAYRILKDDRGKSFGYLEYLAIHPAAKKRGLGLRLFRYSLDLLTKAGADYALSTTAVGAHSSVRCHEKAGFRKIGLHSYSSTNYFSYLFRQYLFPDGLSKKETIRRRILNSRFVCRSLFASSYVWTKLTRTEAGTGTQLVQFVKRLSSK